MTVISAHLTKISVKMELGHAIILLCLAFLDSAVIHQMVNVNATMNWSHALLLSTKTIRSVFLTRRQGGLNLGESILPGPFAF